MTGAFLVSEMYFTMPEDWEVRVTVRSADGKQETQKFALRL